MQTHLASIYRKLEVSSKLELYKVLEGDGVAPRDKTDQAAIISELALTLEEALSEGLRLISRSEGRIDDVIEALMGCALDLCDAQFGLLLTYNADDGFTARFMKGIPHAFQGWWIERGN